ncbi:MAG: NAD-dependent epimerase/dehydratase family protein [Proteobacteria bacterium]|nr:NAD-dependent epimerase/dehydratase family protein [Pseudomonadota bacterium]
MNIFVTGATGFIGRRLVAELLRRDIGVITMQRHKDPNFSSKVRQVCGDITNPDSFGDAGLGCDRLYHLAAMVTFDPGKKDALFAVNGQGTRNVLDAARRWGVKRSVVVSSACTMGLSNSIERSLAEDSRPDHEHVMASPYLASKLITESEAMAAAEKAETVIVNPTTVYGPGDWSLNSGTLVLKVASSKILPVPPGGSNVVDVDDVVQGIIAAGETGASGRRYILGGENLHFSEIFSIVSDIVGRRPVFVPLPLWLRWPVAMAVRAAGMVTDSRFLTPQLVSDLFSFKNYSSQRAEEELAWRRRYTFRESVARAWEFYSKEGL